jgi:hypothetical protein
VGLTHNFILNRVTTCSCKFSQSNDAVFVFKELIMGAIHKIRDAVFTHFYRSLPPCGSVWQLAVHPIIKYVTLSQPPPPTPKKTILTKHKFNTQQQIQNVIYKSTLFLLNLSLKSFPLRFSLVCWLNGSAVFHDGNVRRSILIENINWSSEGHIRSCTVLFCYI